MTITSNIAPPVATPMIIGDTVFFFFLEEEDVGGGVRVSPGEVDGVSEEGGDVGGTVTFVGMR